jgi:Protein phosphatase 2C
MADSRSQAPAPGNTETTKAGTAGAGTGDGTRHAGRWHVSAGNARGAVHRTVGRPNQDSVAHRAGTTRSGETVVAVADGHGHSRHFRSATGSALAVAVGCRVGSRLAASFAGPAARMRVEAAVRSELPQTMVREWRAAVAEHLTAHPYTAAEQAALETAGDGPAIPYGSTLLLTVTWSHWLACAQIGDGDILAVCPDGRSFAPVPPGALPVGPRTTSLCQPDALDAFRVGVRDLDEEEILALLLATDGYGNSQVADPWQPEVGRDLAKLAAERDHHWFARQVPRWAQRCASADGSGDDTTIALLLHPDAMAMASRAGVTAQRRPPPGPPEPATSPPTQPAPPPPTAARKAGPRRPSREGPPPERPTEARTRPGRRGPRGWRAAVGIAAAGLTVAVVLFATQLLARHPGGQPASGVVTSAASSAPATPSAHPTHVPARRAGVTVIVRLPPEVTSSGPVTDALQTSHGIFLLAGNRVWRVPLPGGPALPVLSTRPLDGPFGPLQPWPGGAIAVPGKSGSVIYVIDPNKLTVCSTSAGPSPAPACGAQPVNEKGKIPQ